MFGVLKSDQEAFTLVEIIAVLAIVGVLLVFFFSFNRVFQSRAQADSAQQRMQKIVVAMQSYYAAHENLPAPVGADPDVPEVPVDALKLESKYRLDVWGQPIRYFMFTNDGEEPRPGEILIDPLSPPAQPGEAMVVIDQGSRTLIRGVRVYANGRPVAGVIISSWPDQVFGYRKPPLLPDAQDYAQIFEPEPDNEAGKDDIFLAIDVHKQAVCISLAELKILNEKAKAFDERFAGIDNNGRGGVDENGCSAVAYPNPQPPDYAYPLRISSCAVYPRIPSGNYLPVSNEDFSCGLPTLDRMKARFCGMPWNCADNGYYFPRIREYEMVWIDTDPSDPPDPTDPSDGYWRENTCGYIEPDYYRIPLERGNPSPNDCKWGLVETLWGQPPDDGETNADQARAFIFCLNNLAPSAIVDPWLNGYIWGCGDALCQNRFADGDPHYHRFFSAGPDGVPNTPDDIIS